MKPNILRVPKDGTCAGKVLLDMSELLDNEAVASNKCRNHCVESVEEIKGIKKSDKFEQGHFSFDLIEEFKLSFGILAE